MTQKESDSNFNSKYLVTQTELSIGFIPTERSFLRPSIELVVFFISFLFFFCFFFWNSLIAYGGCPNKLRGKGVSKKIDKLLSVLPFIKHLKGVNSRYNQCLMALFFIGNLIVRIIILVYISFMGNNNIIKMKILKST